MVLSAVGAAYLTEASGAVLTTEAGALVAANKNEGTSVRTRQAITGRRTGHAAPTLVLALPGAVMNAGSARLVAGFAAVGVLAANLYVNQHVNIMKCTFLLIHHLERMVEGPYLTRKPANATLCPIMTNLHTSMTASVMRPST